MPITEVPNKNRQTDNHSQMYELGRDMVRTVNSTALEAARFSIYVAGRFISPVERRIRYGIEDAAYSSVSFARSLGARAIRLNNQIVTEEYRDSSQPITIVDDRSAS